MKNIHVLKTDKPSRLFKLAGDLHLHKECEIDPKRNQNIYITSDEEIKEGDWCICLENIFKNEIFKVDSDTPNKSSNVTLEFAKKYLTKITLTTDQDLIKDGVQAIDDEFLEWFVKNPSCEKVETVNVPYFDESGYSYLLIAPKEEPKQETLEEVAETFLPHSEIEHDTDFIIGFIAGAKWQQERMYSEEESIQKIIDYVDFQFNTKGELNLEIKKWFEQFKKK